MRVLGKMFERAVRGLLNFCKFSTEVLAAGCLVAALVAAPFIFDWFWFPWIESWDNESHSIWIALLAYGPTLLYILVVGVVVTHWSSNSETAKE